MEYRLFLVILLLLTIINSTSATVKPHSNITLNSFVMATAFSSRRLSWLSSSGDFAFGFLPLPTNSSLFLLAIWYANLPKTTIIWTPNRNKPVPSNSSVILTSDGQLSLRHPAGTEI
ncbi:G-type lectin S-receptor-like serine/threonine-protein kinase RLK1 [Dendrobium catenatum]|uniref:G-type lectin S-receptor-like serine/threonine-protein kinase RLK1 n=1 Tax=Dendrobium catenatum TaxID=906689 RepID=A0A2I0WMS7_9ASPA|nr:G-type lectin S-receptor-like serine/threonine-protein kinase RLK1 [Dendrobium catenatum]